MIGPWETFSFAYPWLLLLLLAVPLLAMLAGRTGRAPAVLYSSLAPLRGCGNPRRARIGGLLLSLFLLGLTLLLVALARPRLGKTISRVQASGIDIMLALDVSTSMLAEDLSIGNQRVNRVDAIKQVTEKFIEARPNDRIGMICFAGRPYLVSPLTLDHDWLLKNLERVRIGLVEDGTAIGSAIASAVNRLKEKESKSRIVVLLTDGENTAGKVSPATAAEAAKALGVKVYTVGAGTRGTTNVPVGRNIFGQIEYEAREVTIDEKSLREIAALTDAQYYRATDGKSLREIFAQIDQMEKSSVELDKFEQFQELFPWFLGAGFSFISLQLLLSQTLWRKLP